MGLKGRVTRSLLPRYPFQRSCRSQRTLDLLIKVKGEVSYRKCAWKSIRTHQSHRRLREFMHKLTDSARKILEGKNFVYLATVNPDGTPQVTPTWVDTEGDFVLINTAIGRVKHRNVKKNPIVALAITEHNNPYDLVVIKGKVVEHVTGKVAED